MAWIWVSVRYQFEFSPSEFADAILNRRTANAENNARGCIFMKDKCSVYGSESCPGPLFIRASAMYSVCGENPHGGFILYLVFG